VAFVAVAAAANSVAREEIAVQHDFLSVVLGAWPCAPRATSVAKTKAVMRNSIEFILVLRTTRANVRTVVATKPARSGKSVESNPPVIS